MRTAAKNLCFLLLLLCGLPLLHALLAAPRTWAANETPIAFWAWRNEAPTSSEIEQVIRQTGARRLFLRAGQFDLVIGSPQRIRPMKGPMPAGMEIHLAYNMTRDLLEKFESTGTAPLAEVITGTFLADAQGAQITGLQLDFDIPTRLLDRYAALLRAVRPRLPQGTQLSVTGLPTWMGSSRIDDLLKETDFWTPQLYGATIPDGIDKRIPIASPTIVRQAVVKARECNRPFYAGLAAYGYAVLYSEKGALIEVRGDLDPAMIANQPQLELIESRPFDESPGSDRRYVYRAKSDVTIDGLVIHAGEQLMLDVPTTASLRTAARAVREEAGDRLLGLCLFRLPGSSDPSNLSIEEIAAALADRNPEMNTDLKAWFNHGGTEPQRKAGSLVIETSNAGGGRAMLGEGAMTIEISIPAGSLAAALSNSHFDRIETLCQNSQNAPSPCSARRANLLRLGMNSWSPRKRARATLQFNSPESLPARLPARLQIRLDDGRLWQEVKELGLGVRGEG